MYDPNPQSLTPEQQAIFDAVPLRQPGPFDLAFSTAATTRTTSAAAPTTFDLAALEKLLADVPPEPIGEWMREQGFPPETSVLILPAAMRDKLPPFGWPTYVRFSLNARDPMLVKNALADFSARYRK